MSSNPTCSRPRTDGQPHRAPSRVGRVTRIAVVCSILALPAAGSILVVLDVITNGQNGVQGLAGARGVAVSPDGRNVYAVGALDDAISVFERDPVTGALDLLEVHRDGFDGVENLRSPTDVAVSPDGRHVYVTSELDDALVVFRRASFGRLGYVRSYVSGIDGVSGIGGASAVAVNRDGTLVFVTGGLEDALAVFSRDPSSDALTLSDVESWSGGVPGLMGASDVAVSPDGRHVYTTADIDDAIVVFAKDPTQDAVAFVEWLPNGSNGVTGISGASSISVDASGRYVFATGRLSDALAVFTRHPGSGWLDPATVYANTQIGVSGLAGASDVVLDRSSELVCVTGSDDDSLVLFRRSPGSAELEPAELLTNGVGSVYGLAGASAISASPDGRHVYVTSAYDDSLVTVATTSNLFFDGFESGDLFSWGQTLPLLEDEETPLD